MNGLASLPASFLDFLDAVPLSVSLVLLWTIKTGKWIVDIARTRAQPPGLWCLGYVVVTALGAEIGCIALGLAVAHSDHDEFTAISREIGCLAGGILPGLLFPRFLESRPNLGPPPIPAVARPGAPARGGLPPPRSPVARAKRPTVPKSAPIPQTVTFKFPARTATNTSPATERPSAPRANVPPVKTASSFLRRQRELTVAPRIS